MIEVVEMRYRADITAGALKLPESRIIADLLLRNVDAAEWKAAINEQNLLQARSPAKASRLTKLIRSRLTTMALHIGCGNDSSELARCATLPKMATEHGLSGKLAIPGGLAGAPSGVAKIASSAIQATE